MVDLEPIGRFVGLSLPSLFLVIWAADAILLVAEDVFLIALLQVILIGVFVYKY